MIYLLFNLFKEIINSLNFTNPHTRKTIQCFSELKYNTNNAEVGSLKYITDKSNLNERSEGRIIFPSSGKGCDGVGGGRVSECIGCITCAASVRHDKSIPSLDVEPADK